MASTESLNLEQLGQTIQSSMQIIAELHEMLDVIEVGKVHPDEVEETTLGGRQAPIHYELEQVTEIIATVEGDPSNVLIQDDPRRHEQLCEAVRVHAPFAVLLEIDATLAQQLDGIGGVSILPDVEFPEIELPHAVSIRAAVWEVAVFIRKRQPQLY